MTKRKMTQLVGMVTEHTQTHFQAYCLEQLSESGEKSSNNFTAFFPQPHVPFASYSGRLAKSKPNLL